MTDREYERKLLSYIKEKKIIAEQLIFNESCHSVEEAARAVKASADDFVKSICLINNEQKLIVAVVKGESRVDLKKVSKELNIDKIRTAKPDEMLLITGYPCGGTTPFGYEAQFLIDKKVLEKDVVYAGGGSEKSLIKISVKELLEANNGKVCDISK